MSRISCDEPNQLEVEPNALRRGGGNISVHTSAIGSCISQRILLVMGQSPKTALTLGIVVMRISWGDVLCAQLCHAICVAQSLMSLSYSADFPYK